MTTKATAKKQSLPARKRELMAQWQAAAAEVLAQYSIVLQDGEAHVETPYGTLYVHLYDDWCHFCLLDFGGNYPAPWYGWRHWKQNFHTWIDQLRAGEYLDIETLDASFSAHVAGFYRDHGHGLPNDGELSALKSERAERDRHWAEAFSKAAG